MKKKLNVDIAVILLIYIPLHISLTFNSFYFANPKVYLRLFIIPLTLIYMYLWLKVQPLLTIYLSLEK